MANKLRPYLTCIRSTLTAALCSQGTRRSYTNNENAFQRIPYAVTKEKLEQELASRRDRAVMPITAIRNTSGSGHCPTGRFIPYSEVARIAHAVMQIVGEQDTLEGAREVVRWMERQGWYKLDPHFYTTIIDTLGEASCVELAEKLFSSVNNSQVKKDVALFNTMINARGKAGRIEPAMDNRAESMWGLGNGVVRRNLEQPWSTWPLRQCSTKASYRSSVIAKSTGNMPLTPKKWKRTLPSKEVLNAVYSLRRVKRNPDAIKEVLRKYVARLLKLEMMLVLSELQRLDEWHLAHQVFSMIRREYWYRPDVYLFQTMVQVFGKNKQLKLAEKMFEELEDEGLQPDDGIKRELLRSYVICGMMSEAIQLYKEILKLGKDQAARSILFHGLSPEEKEDLANYERQNGIDWSFVEKRQ